MTDIKLLPCPFCGARPRMRGYRDRRFATCDTSCCMGPHRPNDLDAADAWNARANVAHATAAKDAEIERLRTEREVIGAEAVKYADKSGRLEAKVERLAEALREARDMVEDWAVYASGYFRDKHDLQGDLAKLDAALRDHDQEGKL